MSKLEALKIRESPFAFASFAEKHNALVDLIAGITGQNGITVVVAEKNAIIRGNIANGGGGGAIANLTNVAVVTQDGRLQNVLSNTALTNNYPASGKYVTASGNVTVDSVGVSILTSGGKYCNIAFANIARDIGIRTVTVCNYSSGAQQSMDILSSAAY